MPLLQRLFVLIKQLMFTLFTFSGQNFLTLFVRGKQSNVELRISKQEHHHMHSRSPSYQYHCHKRTSLSKENF